MKTNIKARVTCLVTLIMVNKCEKFYFIAYISDKLLSSFFLFYFIPFHILFFSFFLSFFDLNLSYSSRMRILFCLHIWAELSFLFNFGVYERNLCGRWGGGGARASSAPPVYAPERGKKYIFVELSQYLS